SGLAPGVYRVMAAPPETQTADTDGRLLQPTYHPGRISPAEATGIAVAAGDTFDSTVITMLRAAPRKISGHVFAPDGSPAVHTSVRAVRGLSFAAGITAAAPQPTASAFEWFGETDGEGRFTGSVGPNQYDVVAGGAAGIALAQVPIDTGNGDVRDIVVQL